MSVWWWLGPAGVLFGWLAARAWYTIRYGRVLARQEWVLRQVHYLGRAKVPPPMPAGDDADTETVRSPA